MRLSQREQIQLQKAAHDNPGSLADWLLGWVEAQQRVGVNGSFDINEVPIPVDLDRVVPPAHPTITPHSYQQGSIPGVTVEGIRKVGTVTATKEAREAAREKWRKILEEVDYPNLPKHQRKAINKFKQARITVVEETDRNPDTEVCWMGDHDMEDWEGDDFYLWVVTGIWSSQKPIRKWGCKDCAMAIAKTHPEATVNEVG